MNVGRRTMAEDENRVIDFSSAARHARPGKRLLPTRLLEARLAQRLNQTELATSVGVSRQSVSAYELGTKTPEPDIMQALSKRLGQPIGFFTRNDLPTFGPPSANFYRKVGPDTKRRNVACATYADWLAQTAYAFDQWVNYPEADIPAFDPESTDVHAYSDEEIERAAEEVRSHFGLGLGPISNVVRLLESKGVIACRLRIPHERIEAFSFWRGERPFVFLTSEKESAARLRFDVAHELGHLCLHRWVSAEDIEDTKVLKAVEREADRFAGAFLLPRKSFPNEVYSPRLMAFVDLKHRWRVSIQAMIFRCKDLEIFDEQQVTNLYKQISRKNWRTREPLDGAEGLPFEDPLLLSKVVSMVLDAELISSDELCHRLGFAPSWIERLAGLEENALLSAHEISIQPSLK